MSINKLKLILLFLSCSAHALAFGEFGKALGGVFLGENAANILKFFDQICSKFSGSIALPDTGAIDISLTLSTACGQQTKPLQQIEDLFNSPLYNASNKLVIYCKGFFEQESAGALADAFSCRGDVNFVNIELSVFTYYVVNAQKIGKQIAEALSKLDATLLDNLQLIGFSLGAQVAGAIARSYKQLSGASLPHLTLLDPVKACFDANTGLPPVQKGDANYIEVIHTNPGGIGVEEPIGNADFYDRGNSRTLPTGCVDIICAHTRSWRLYAETINAGYNNLLANKCATPEDLSAKNCNGAAAFVGLTAEESEGIFLLQVNAEPPYGKDNVNLQREACAIC